MQWGIGTTYQGWKTENKFAVSFNQVWSVILTPHHPKNSGAVYAEAVGITQVKNTGFFGGLQSTTSENNFYFIATGIQQWGYYKSNLVGNIDVTIKFPIAFTNIFTAISQSTGSNSSWPYGQQEISNNSIKVVSQGNTRNGCWWVAIGK